MVKPTGFALTARMVALWLVGCYNHATNLAVTCDTPSHPSNHDGECPRRTLLLWTVPL